MVGRLENNVTSENRTWHGFAVLLMPLKKMEPLVIVRSRVIILNVVVLPAPFMPNSPKHSPTIIIFKCIKNLTNVKRNKTIKTAVY